MKPQLKTELVMIERWDCGNPDHHHKTERVAQDCIKRRENKTTNPFTIRWTNAALAQVLAAHRDGARQCDLARSLRLSRERVRQVLRKAERAELLGETNDPLVTLSTRVWNSLKRANLRTVDDVRSALAEGRLDDVYDLGSEGMREIKIWLSEFHSA